MAWGDVVQTKTGTSTTATTTPAFDNPVAAGNLVQLTIAADDYNSSPNAGWTERAEMEQQTFHGGYLWEKVIASDGQTIPDYTIGSAVRSEWTIVEYEGPYDTNSYDGSQGNFVQSSSSTITSDSLTPGAGDRLVIGVLHGQHSSSDIANNWGSLTGGFTARANNLYNGGNPRLVTVQASQKVTADGSASYSIGGTIAGAGGQTQSRSALIAAYKEAGPPPPVVYVGAGSPVAGTTSITTAAYPAEWQAGDKIVGVVASNHTTEATEPTISGFTKIGTLNGGGGSQGAGTGNRRLTYFERDAAGGDDTTPTVSLSGGNVMVVAFLAFRPGSGYEWDSSSPMAVAFGAETTAGTSWSQVMDSDPGLAADDLLVLACAVRDTSDSTAEGITATGCTFGSVDERADLSSETGNDIALHVSTVTVLTGPNSATPTRTATHSTSETGVAGVLRLRAAAAGGTVEVDVDPATLTLAGVDPDAAGSGTAAADLDVAPLALTGLTPDAAGSGAAGVSPDVAALALAGQDVDASTGATSVDVDPAQLTLTGQDTPATGTGAGGPTADPAALVLAPQTPTVAGTGAAATAPDPAVLVVAGVDPQAAGAGTATLTADPAALTLAGQTPDASTGGAVVDPATLTLTGQDVAATGTGTASVTVDTATLALSGQTPTAGTGVSEAVVDPAVLTLTGQAPAAAGTGTGAQVVDVAVLALAGVGVVASAGTVTVAVDPAALTLTGQTPGAPGPGPTPVTVDVAVLTITGLTPTPVAAGTAAVIADTATLTLAGVEPAAAGQGAAGLVAESAVLALEGVEVIAVGLIPDPHPITLTVRGHGNRATAAPTPTRATARSTRTSATVREN